MGAMGGYDAEGRVDQAGIELLVLQAVRLGGVADTDAVVDRAPLREADVERTLDAASRAGWVERFIFGDTSGWIITDDGSTRLAELLRAEVLARDATTVLEATHHAFEPLNDRFVALVSRWQLESSPAAGAASADKERLVSSLLTIGEQLREVLSELIRVLPRFGRYPAQYAAAAESARRGDLSWVAGVGFLSCHTVWAELHQDLLSTLGRDRSTP